MNKIRIIVSLVVITIVVTASVFATKFAEPSKRTIFSANQQFCLTVDPATGTHTVFGDGGKGKPLWSFERHVWHDDYFVSNDGQHVAWVAWEFIKNDELQKPCLIIYGEKGILSQYIYGELSQPREYKEGEVGPIGAFWRIWRDNPATVKDEILQVQAVNKGLQKISLVNGELLK